MEQKYFFCFHSLAFKVLESAHLEQKKIFVSAGSLSIAFSPTPSPSPSQLRYVVPPSIRVTVL